MSTKSWVNQPTVDYPYKEILVSNTTIPAKPWMNLKIIMLKESQNKKVSIVMSPFVKI